MNTPSGTIKPTEPLLLYIVLVMTFYHNNMKVTKAVNKENSIGIGVQKYVQYSDKVEQGRHSEQTREPWEGGFVGE